MNTISVKPSSNPYTLLPFHKLYTNPKLNPVSYTSLWKKPFRKKQSSTTCSKFPYDNTFNTSNSSLPTNLFSILTPFLQSFKHFTAKYTWVSSYPSFKTITCVKKTQSLHNGGLGMAFVTVKSTARDRFSPFIAALANNPTFMSGLLAWLFAQSMKVVLNFIVERKWDLKILCASGGMPSSHSALCTALTTSVAFCHGVSDSLFPVCLGFSLIVMYDAIGVRRHAGMQAEVLNKIIEDLFQGHPISERKLKELLGHTPSQVFAGALLGIVVACFCCQGCFVPV